MKKILAVLLAVMMVFSMTAAVAEDAAAEKGTVIYGSTTEIGGDFAPGAWYTNNATDVKIRDLSNDYYTVTTNQGGEYVINETVTDSIDGVVNEDGTKTFTIKVKEGLVYNNGEAITAKDFVWGAVWSCSKLAADVGAKMTGYLTYVGGQEYYDGTATAISGVRLIDDYTFAVTIVADKIPYFYDLAYAAFGAFNLKYWLGEGIDVADDGEGCYFTGDYTTESVQKQLEYARFNGNPDRVSAGPYNLVEFDQAAKQATFTLNPNYAGNFEGQKPSIEKIVIVKAEDATWNDAIKTGAFNFYDTITDGTEVNEALDIIEDTAVAEALGYGFKYVQFDRAGFGMIHFHSDFSPTQFVKVRQAIAMLLDRNEFANTFCNGWGGVVNGPFGTGMWQYQDSEEVFNEQLNTYTYDPEAAVALLVEDGWVYDEAGNDYVEGIRYKKVTAEEAANDDKVVTLADGTLLMPLIIEWSSSEGNSVSELLKVMLAESDATAAAGMKINQTIMTFTELLNYYYRDASQGDKYGVPYYSMFNLATNFTPAYDQSYSWTLDPDMVAQGYNIAFLFDKELDDLSMNMVYGVESSDTATYLDYFQKYVIRWNNLLPEIPLYSNVYITMYPDWLENYEQDSFWDFQQAIVYATVAE